jgi:hypothetical protein
MSEPGARGVRHEEVDCGALKLPRRLAANIAKLPVIFHERD